MSPVWSHKPSYLLIRRIKYFGQADLKHKSVVHFVTVLSGAYFCTEPRDRGQNDTDTRHRDIRQPKRGSRQDDPLRHLRQLPRDEGRACRGRRLRFPALHPEVPQGRHQEIRRRFRPLLYILIEKCTTTPIEKCTT